MEPNVAQIHAITMRAAPITLPELAPIALLDRMDTKFIAAEDALCEALADTIQEYRVLEINGVRPGRYHTVYFDTERFDMYHAHHNGERMRYKLRCREYLDSKMTFLEVKQKNNKERTTKFRIRIEDPITDTSGVDRSWLPPDFPYDLNSVKPAVWNRFRRITLASLDRRERITIDVDIHFGCGNQTVHYPGLAVVEVKQTKFSLFQSPLAFALHRRHINPTGISKFVVAAANFHPGFKANEFKPLLLRLQRHFPNVSTRSL
ncbi:MAG: polyphosphate polymerase domain-containing protein [Anaerolineales bacterium]|nr:polyphosphate polymerase domain-containing protein [Anaerolineales bacterium]